MEKMVSGLSQKFILDKFEHLLDSHSWECSNNVYKHINGVELSFEEEKYQNKTQLSPSSLLSYISCPRKIFLFKNKDHENNFYLNLIGNKTKIGKQVGSIEALNGIITHDVLAILGKYIKPKTSDLKGIGWRTILAPVIHHSVNRSICKYNKEIAQDFDIEVISFEKKITKIIDTVWLKPFLQTGFNKKTWKEDFNKLSLKCETEISKEGFSGIADLIIKSGKKDYIIDYKTTKHIPEINKNNFSDEETYEILNSQNNELFPYVLQISSYCWMYDTNSNCSDGWIAYTSDENIRILKFNIGHKSKEYISGLINTVKKEFELLNNQKKIPKGNFSPPRCIYCPYKINCVDFYEGSKNYNFENWFENSKKPLPILTNVYDVIPEESKILINLNERKYEIIFRGSHKNYLDLVKDVLTQGHKIRSYMELYGSVYKIITNVAKFSRCD